MSSTQHQLIKQCATRLRGIVEALDNIHDTSPHRWSTDLDEVHSSAESLLALINDQAPTQDAQGLAGTALRDSPASVEQAGVDERAVDGKPRATKCPDCGEGDLMPGDLCACGYETDPAAGYACSECDGSGDGYVGEVCRECDGSGWFVTPEQARAALAQPSGEVVVTKNESGAIVSVTRQDKEGRVLSVIAESATLTAQAEKAEVERPEGPTEDELEAAGLGYPLHKEEAVKLWYSGFRSEVITVLEAWEAIGHDIGMNPDKGELLDSLRYMLEKCEAHDAALAEVAGLRSLLNSLLCYVERDIDRMRSDRDKSDNKEIYDRSISLAMERLKAAQNAVFTTEPGCDTAVELAAQTTQAQHSVPEVSGIGRDFAYPRSVVLYLRTEPTDDDLRAIHDGLRSLAAAPGKEVPQAWLDVQAERRRQITAEGWTPEHDDEHDNGEMARAAACYALAGSSAPSDGTAALLVSLAWPWDEQWWKPSTARRDMVKACALGLAEIERLDRVAASQGGSSDA
ncbi:hypothetical protein ACPZLB_004884 [Pseudomonas aeruginosa]